MGRQGTGNSVNSPWSAASPPNVLVRPMPPCGYRQWPFEDSVQVHIRRSTGSVACPGDKKMKLSMLTDAQVKYAHRVQLKIRTPKPLLEIIKELGYLTDEQIQRALQDHAISLRIGDFLVEMGLITEHDLTLALDLQKQESPRRKLGEVLVANNLIEERKLIHVLSLQLGFPFIEPDALNVDAKLFWRGSVDVFKKHNFVPIGLEDEKILVAFADPMDKRDVDAATTILQMPVIPAIATKPSIKAAIEHFQPKTETADYVSSETGESVVDMVNAIIVDAIKAVDVSDIHIDPMADRLRVRFRLDGVLVKHRDLPKSIAQALSTRIKVLCKADIAERRRHQGGRILFDYDDHHIDIRVSFYATVKGEKIVFRLLNRKAELLDIDQIGMSRRVMHRFREDALDRPSGVIMVTGPTGSGKTTTVYSCINHLNTTEASIITAEDPVEYVIDGIGQCSIDPKINLTFEDSLRHMVRQAPDIIVIGEIRDTYSAEVAVQAALTGHKVLTTFHTEDSIGKTVRNSNRIMNQSQSFLQMIKAYLSNKKASLPVFDTTGLKIKQEASKPESETDKIENLITCDPSLTSQVLRVANSAFYKGLQKAATVRTAIVRLGSRETANIAILVSQKKQFQSKTPFINDQMHLLWRHSVGCAISAQWIARRCGLNNKAQEAFTSGLLHDMGKLVILTVTDAIIRAGELKQMPTDVLLNEVMAQFHTVYGFAWLRAWNLPDIYCQIARDHHKSEVEEETDLMMMVRLANRATNSLGIGMRGVEPCVLAATAEADYFGLSEVDLAELEIKLEDAEVFSQ